MKIFGNEGYSLTTKIIEKINQLQQQILVHSILYYRLGCSIWSDAKWNSKAKELQAMAETYTEEYQESILFQEFKDFSWVSGYDLPLYDPKYTAVALWVMKYAETRGELL